MQWNPDLMATKVESVDNQHQEIIRRVNNLVEKAADAGDEIMPEIELLLDFLADYVMVHFSSEESLQTEVSYPGYDGHKAEHDGFIERFVDMRARFLNVGATGSNIKALVDMTEGWLTEHIAGSDAVFAAFYRKAKEQNQ